MIDDRSNNGSGKNTRRNPKTLAGMLTAAVDMEEQIGSGVYEDYLASENWPAELEEDIFETIQGFLTTLIEDTKKHRRILDAIVKEYSHES